MHKADWREYIVGVFLILVGFIYLVVQVISIVRGENATIKSDAEAIYINRYALFNELRVYVTICASIAGGWLLIRMKRLGWMLSLTMILLFAAIALAALIKRLPL
jgi:hypothetical protein